MDVGNRLIDRVFTLAPTFGTIDQVRHAEPARGGSQSMFRSVHPEAEVVLDNITFEVGALVQNRTFLAYCNRSDFGLGVNPDAWQYANYSISAPEAPYPWVPGTRHSPTELSWPPKGTRLTVRFVAPRSAGQYKAVLIEVSSSDINITVYLPQRVARV